MQLKELIPLFDKAIGEKNEVELYNIGYKIAFIYCSCLDRKKHIGLDCEGLASELVLRCLEVAKETDYQKENRYYLGILKTGSRYKYLQLLKNDNVLSLDDLCTNEHGETFLDCFDIQNVNTERSNTESLRTDLVNEIREIADTYKTRNEVWEIIKAKYPVMEKSYFLRLVHMYRIQFSEKDTRLFLNCMKIYSIYKMLGEDIKTTRRYVLENKIEHSGGMQVNINLAKDFLDMFQTNKKRFMARFVLPPNATSREEKYFC